MTRDAPANKQPCSGECQLEKPKRAALQSGHTDAWALHNLAAHLMSNSYPEASTHCRVTGTTSSSKTPSSCTLEDSQGVRV